MKLSPFDRYLIFGLRQVEGWLDSYSAEFIFMLSTLQTRAGIEGSVGEIGIHHGKLFMVLLLGAEGGEKAIAIDIFEDQHLNVDQSGSGNRTIFMANVRQWVGSIDRVETIARSSLEVRPEDILGKVGPLRLASIDGGHTEECTVNDLHLFDACLAPRGIVIIDDYFNPHWPDVSSGVAKYCLNPSARLRPFAISPNKVYLAASEDFDFYRTRISEHRQFRIEKMSRMFGADVAIYACDPGVPSIAREVKAALKRSALGPYLLALKKKMSSTP